MSDERVYTDDMGEISGFGGSYEKACRDMVLAGVKWFDGHPRANPRFHGFEGVYGIIAEDNEDAKALSKAMVDAAGGDCTGAMHQATVSHVLWIRKHSWKEYVEKRRAFAKEE